MTLRFLNRLIIPLLAAYLLNIQSVGAVKIVRLELEYGGAGVATGGYAFPKVSRTLDLELFDDATPATVANYLNYVNDGRYELTFVNRSEAGFLLQTGGVTNISPDPENDPISPSNFDEVPKFPPVINEPGLSNIRGTVAMAKLSNDPDSATSEWFINLNNNSSLLDTDNGGVTVFGRLIDDGIDIADEIASFPTINISFLFGAGSPFSSSFFTLPLADYDVAGSETIFQRNLVMVLSATEITRPILRFTPSEGDFGFYNPADAIGVPINVILTNSGNEILEIDPIAAGGINPPFTVESENCSGAVLDPVSIVPTSSCSLSLLFLPEAIDVFHDSLTIGYKSQVSADSFSSTFHVSGEGATSPPMIDVSDEFNVGISQAGGFPIKKDFLVRNTGSAALKISAISGLSSPEFSQTNDCLSNGATISAENFCTITVTFSTSDLGLKTDILTVESNDPANKVVNITVVGTGDSDSDGVLSSIEQAGPNQGDGNNDGIGDYLQNNVASFVSAQGDYVTLVSEDAVNAKSLNFESETAIGGVLLLSELPEEAPAITSFDNGLHHFEINLPNNGLLGDAVRVALYLPVDVKVAGYYRFGPTPDNEAPHWYDFAFDDVTQTGAIVIGKVTIPSLSGVSIERNMVIINFVDGLRGDDDLTANAKIVHGIGGVDVKSPGSSSGSAAYLFVFGLLFYFRRRHLKKL